MKIPTFFDFSVEKTSVFLKEKTEGFSFRKTEGSEIRKKRSARECVFGTKTPPNFSCGGHIIMEIHLVMSLKKPCDPIQLEGGTGISFNFFDLAQSCSKTWILAQSWKNLFFEHLGSKF
mgnify:CR=1 FL=1